MLTVDIAFLVEKDGKIEWEVSGKVILEDGKLRVEPEQYKWAIEEPIMANHELIDPKKDPEKFIRNLSVGYSNSSRLGFGDVKEVDNDKDSGSE